MRKEKSSVSEDRALGAMYGMAVGDALGAPLEFHDLKYDRTYLQGMEANSRFRMQPGQWTDDTSMGLCVADSFLCNQGLWRPHDCMQRFLAWWHCGMNNAFRFQNPKSDRRSVGLGGNISLSFESYLHRPAPYTTAGDKNTSGNGSIMRLAAVPVAFALDDKPLRESAEKIAQLHSRTTHQGDEAAGCCALLTHVMVRCIRGEDLKIVLSSLVNVDPKQGREQQQQQQQQQQHGKQQQQQQQARSTYRPASAPKLRYGGSKNVPPPLPATNDLHIASTSSSTAFVSTYSSSYKNKSPSFTASQSSISSSSSQSSSVASPSSSSTSSSSPASSTSTFTCSVRNVMALAHSQYLDADNNWHWCVNEQYHYNQKRAQQNPKYIGSYAMDATCMALNAAWRAAIGVFKRPQDALLAVVNLGGDADSVGSVTGQLLGAGFGMSAFDRQWLEAVWQWDKGEIGLRAYRLLYHYWLRM